VSDKPVLTPGPDHPITVEPAPGTVRVLFGDRQIADTDDALVLAEADYPPVLYIPLEDVESDVLEPSSHETYCPFKGDASYYTLRDGDRVAENAVWTYPKAYPAVQEIAGHVAFYPKHVEIELEAA
jgi:uncharacterized protein (DUF427 family)